jgi:hypothetical protein
MQFKESLDQLFLRVVCCDFGVDLELTYLGLVICVIWIHESLRLSGLLVGPELAPRHVIRE